MVGDTDSAALGLVLGVVVGDDGRDGAAQNLETAGVHLIVESPLVVAFREASDERHAERHPHELRTNTKIQKPHFYYSNYSL